MRQEAELGLRRLLLTVSTFVFLGSFVAIYALQYLPQVSVHLKRSFTIYLLLFSATSVTGFFAALKRNAMLITIVAIHLAVDSILLFIPRILTIRYSLNLPGMICSNSNYDEFSQPNIREAASAVKHVTQKIEIKLQHLSSPTWSEGSCRVWMWGLEVVFVSMVFLHIGSQALLSARLFGYATWLGRHKRLRLVQLQHHV